MSQPGYQRPAVSADDALPPVEPPSAGFIVQLFVIPGIIVFIIVMIWLLFNWLAQKGNDPAAFVRELSKNNANRWQAAVNLADALRQSRADGPDSLKNNTELARQISDVLASEIKTGSMEKDSLELRIFLCRALGEFRVNFGLPVLLQAAETRRGAEEDAVRCAALSAIALLAQNAPAPAAALEELRQQVVLAASRDEDKLVRSTAAFAMGVVGGDALLARLREMLTDNYPDARYNAATGLARHGDPASVEVLAEMLDPDESAGLQIEDNPKARDYKRALIVVNGLRAARQLVSHESAADRPTIAALEQAAAKLKHSQFGKSMGNNQVGIELAELELELQKKPVAEPASRGR
jgi:HEAT repeat protein